MSGGAMVDGDDYTWDEMWGKAAATAMAPAALVIRGRRYSMLDELTEMTPAQAGGAGAPDLRTADAKERDDVAALELRLAALEATVVRLVNLLGV